MKKAEPGFLVSCLAHLAALAIITSCGPSGRSVDSPPPFHPPTGIAAKSAPPRLLQGPMLGFVSDNEASVWVRLNGPNPVRVRYGLSDPLDSQPDKISEEVRALAENDYTAVVRLRQLKPSTKYRYRILLRSGSPALGKPFLFRTLPPAGKADSFRIAFGSCASVDLDSTQKIWKATAHSGPMAFLWLGDNIYGDSSNLAVLRKKYRRQRMVKSLLGFQATVPQLAIWDDHDYGRNDGDRRFDGKRNSLKVFREYWANPNFGLPTTPGVFFRWSIGNVDFFFLDTRTYRDPNLYLDGPRKTHLGVAQKSWLMNGLKESRAVFKVLVSSNTWTGWKGPFRDSWGSFTNERDEIFNFIRDEGISGVFLIAGDSHRPQMNVIPWSRFGGYDLYEVISSPLAQGVYRGRLWPGGFQHVRPPNAFRRNFGLMEFDTRASPPRVILHLMDDEGKDLWPPLKLTSEELTKGVKSWDKK